MLAKAQHLVKEARESIAALRVAKRVARKPLELPDANHTRPKQSKVRKVQTHPGPRGLTKETVLKAFRMIMTENIKENGKRNRPITVKMAQEWVLENKPPQMKQITRTSMNGRVQAMCYALEKEGLLKRVQSPNRIKKLNTGWIRTH